MLTFRATWVGFFANIYTKKACARSMSTSNKMIGVVSSCNSAIDVYLDGAAELSKIDRKNHHHTSAKGVPLMYDYMVTVSVPSIPPTGFISSTNQTILTGVIKTAPPNWQTRNAVRMAHFTREELRREAGVTKGSIGRYAKTMRLNLDSQMFGIAYNPTRAVDPENSRYQRLYACESPTLNTGGNQASNFTGGVWDYTQLSETRSGDADAFSDYYLSVCDAHSGSPAAGYTRVGVIEAYNQRRQTVLTDSTATPGGDTQFIENDSPFFRVPQQDVSEDAYVDVTLDEQDNPPYDRSTGSASDAVQAQPVEFFNLTMQNTQATFRVQAPLGLLEMNFRNMWGSGYQADPPEWTVVQDVTVEVECLGTYEM